MGSRGRRRLVLWALAALALIALGVAVARLSWAPRAPTLLHFTPDNTAVARLRDAIEGANIVIVVLDAARADHTGCYGYPREATPNIDRLAEEAFVFDRHFCQMPFTRPSTASLFTGRFPDTHGVIWDTGRDPELPFTMAMGLSGAGFRTVLLSSNPKASPAMGIGCEFEEAYYPDQHGTCETPEALLAELSRWLEAHRDERFFAYLHFLPPHLPYDQPAEHTEIFAAQHPPGFDPNEYGPQGLEFPVADNPRWPRLVEPPPLPEWINLYDANLHYGDWALGEVVELLRGNDIFDTTLLIVSSDHGEGFGEHGYLWHARGIYDEATWIPLLIRFPGGSSGGCRIDALTQTIDILPTVFDLLEVEYPAGYVEGQSLLPLLAGMTDEVCEHTVIESFFPHKYMVRGRRYALLIHDHPGWRALYDSEVDPKQRDNIWARDPETAEDLMATFREFAADHSARAQQVLDPGAAESGSDAGGDEPLSPALRNRLRALGYLD